MFAIGYMDCQDIFKQTSLSCFALSKLFYNIIKTQRLQVSNTSDSMIMTDRQFNRSYIIRLRSSFLINLSFEKELSPAGYSLLPSLTKTFLLQFQRLETLIPDCHSLSWHIIIDIDGTDALQMTLTYSISGVHIL